MINISFRTWLEEMSDDRSRVKEALLTRLREMEPMLADEPEQEILQKSLKNMNNSSLEELIHGANVRNIDNGKIKEIITQIRSDDTAEFTAMELIDLLASDVDKAMPPDSKQYTPKSNIPGPSQDTAVPVPMAGVDTPAEAGFNSSL